jgi:hypothetical protein
MLDIEAREGRWRSFSHWETLSSEVVFYNILVGTNIGEYWRHVAEINVAAVMGVAVSRETPPDRRRKFRVINGGTNNRASVNGPDEPPGPPGSLGRLPGG